MKKVVTGLFCGFTLLVMIVVTFYNNDKAKKPNLIGENDVKQQISSSHHNDNTELKQKEWQQRSTDMYTENVQLKSNNNKEALTEKSLPEIISKLSGLDSEIGRVFLALDDVKAIKTLDHKGLKALNERLSQFYIDHDIIEMINNGDIHGDDRQAVSILFAYTAKLRESISEENIALLTSQVNQLKKEINSGDFPKPQPLSLEQRQLIEQQVTENYQKRVLEREAKRKQEDEQLAEEEIAFLSSKS
ncbi:hypothetical protein [uncultured Shewanella sp.]|uniref:hypothetical protein n=1 Tax=uncultured Shewanella sp. TaxID=173975 RepID=UPI0026044C18|nr:hypothetical protein [uncultured Shewanella sp.]